MNDERPDFADSLRRMAAADRAPVESLPTPEELIAYCQGELPAERAEAMRELLVRSPEATQLLLDCQVFLATEDDPDTTEDEPAAREAASVAHVSGPAAPRPGTVPSRATRSWPGLLAAACVGGLLSLAAWTTLRIGSSPAGRANVVIAALQPTTESLRDPRAQPLRSVPADAIVVLYVPELATPEAVRLTMLDAEGTVAWQIEGLAADDEAANSFVVELPGPLLAPGPYTISLLAPGRDAPFARYQLRVIAP